MSLLYSNHRPIQQNRTTDSGFLRKYGNTRAVACPTRSRQTMPPIPVLLTSVICEGEWRRQPDMSRCSSRSVSLSERSLILSLNWSQIASQAFTTSSPPPPHSSLLPRPSSSFLTAVLFPQEIFAGKEWTVFSWYHSLFVSKKASPSFSPTSSTNSFSPLSFSCCNFSLHFFIFTGAAWWFGGERATTRICHIPHMYLGGKSAECVAVYEEGERLTSQI